MKKIIIFSVILIFLLIVIFGLRFLLAGAEANWLCRNGEWVKHGHPLVPPPDMPCVKSSESLIRVISPQANERVSNPLVVKGEARGSWYFEGSFPVRLESLDGKVIASGSAEAEGDWMTDTNVAFTAKIIFKTVDNALANLILSKANPSGLRENDDSLVIPLVLNKNAELSTSTEKMLVPPPVAPPMPPANN